MTEECFLRDAKGQLPAAFSHTFFKRSFVERGPAVYFSDDFHWCMRSVARSSTADEQGSSTVAFKVVVDIFFLVFGKLEEEFTAGVFPYSAVIFCCYGTYAFFLDAVVQQNGISRVSDAEFHFRTVRIVLPVYTIDSLKFNMVFIEQCRNVFCRDKRMSCNFMYM